MTALPVFVVLPKFFRKYSNLPVSQSPTLFRVCISKQGKLLREKT